MKIGIVVPFSWSFWGAVVEHAELQAAARRQVNAPRLDRFAVNRLMRRPAAAYWRCAATTG